MKPPTLRFAPSPNGYLHSGHAYSALLNQQIARAMGGRLLLRIEDIDTGRCSAELLAQMLDDLRWLGLEWEAPVRVQSEHFADYEKAADRLHADGLLYACFCTRKEVAQDSDITDPDGAPLYAGRCRHLESADVRQRIAAGEPHAWRLDMRNALAQLDADLSYQSFDETGAQRTIEAMPRAWGDVVLVRKETPTSYHLAVVVDDALQDITHVVRGDDLRAATDVHVVLQRLLALPTPLYHHHKLLRDADGEKLAKRIESQPLKELRAEGMTLQALRRNLGF